MMGMVKLVLAWLLVGAQPGGLSGELFEDPLNDLYVMGGAGLAGAVLGLSTLSFEENPAKKLKNVVYGGALGVILGVVFIAVKQAGKSKEYYYQHSRREPADLRFHRGWPAVVFADFQF